MHNYLFIVDTYTLVFKIMILFTSIIILWFSLAFIKTTAATNIIEFPIVLACATLSMLLFISSFDLMSMYITLEALSLALYTLAATDYTSEASIESGVKYFAIGAISSALLIYGISLFYGVFIVTDFLHIFKKLYLLSW
jgi:NADH-quinone oxidoreductase subunit N